MGSEKPTVVLVPGICHPPVLYEGLSAKLREAGHPVRLTTLPSLNSQSPKSESIANDVTHIRETMLLPLLSQGKEVLLLMHSYGACPGSAAAVGLSRQEYKSASKQGGIIGLVCIAALLTKEGEQLHTREFPDWVAKDDPLPGLLTVPNPIPLFFNDVSEESASRAAANILPHSMTIFTKDTPTPAPAWADQAYSHRCAYIRCSNDACVPVTVQDRMVQATGIEWHVQTIKSGHDPFLQHEATSAEAAECLLSIASRFRALG